MPNQAHYTIPPNSVGVMVCLSNAAYHQKVVIEYRSSGGEAKALAFYGVGEEGSMTTEAGKKTIPIPFADIDAGDGVELLISVHHNPNKPANRDDYGLKNDELHLFESVNGSHHLASFLSEDSTDNDFNDSSLEIIYMVNG